MFLEEIKISEVVGASERDEVVGAKVKISLLAIK